MVQKKHSTDLGTLKHSCQWVNNRFLTPSQPLNSCQATHFLCKRLLLHRGQFLRIFSCEYTSCHKIKNENEDNIDLGSILTSEVTAGQEIENEVGICNNGSLIWLLTS